MIVRLTTALALASLLVACDSAGDGDRAAGDRRAAGATRIIAHVVDYERESTRVEAVGTARAQASATVFPETGGEVTEVLFRAGDYVEAGDALVKLEAQAERLAVRLARVQVADAELQLQRYLQAREAGAIPASQIDAARTTLDSARIALEPTARSISQPRRHDDTTNGRS